jgi:hypothetical protein
MRQPEQLQGVGAADLDPIRLTDGSPIEPRGSIRATLERTVDRGGGVIPSDMAYFHWPSKSGSRAISRGSFKSLNTSAVCSFSSSGLN